MTLLMMCMVGHAQDIRATENYGWYVCTVIRVAVL